MSKIFKCFGLLFDTLQENHISTLCENLDSLDEPEAKAAMIWIVGQYSDRMVPSVGYFGWKVQTKKYRY